MELRCGWYFKRSHIRGNIKLLTGKKYVLVIVFSHYWSFQQNSLRVERFDFDRYSVLEKKNSKKIAPVLRKIDPNIFGF